MKPRFRDLREQPLLSSLSGGAGPWLELPRNFKDKVYLSLPGKQTHDYKHRLALLAALGYDVEPKVAENRGELASLAEEGMRDVVEVVSSAGPESVSLGLDFSHIAKAREEELKRRVKSLIDARFDETDASAIWIIAGLKALGLDVDDLSAHYKASGRLGEYIGGRIRHGETSGDWKPALTLACAYRDLGYDFGEVKKSRQQMLDAMKKAIGDGKIVDALEIAAPCAKLGLLTPNLGYKPAPMPPLRRFSSL